MSQKSLRALDQAIQRLHEAGAVHVGGLITPQQCERLLRYANGQQFVRAGLNYGTAEQHFEVASFDPLPEYGELIDFIDLFGEIIRTNTASWREGNASSLEVWRPTEAVIQRYDPGVGITRHRDFTGCRLLIAIINLQGKACFRVERSSTDWVAGGAWQLEPGDVVLLRGTGFQNVKFYGRPRHSVDRCEGERTSLVLRMMSPAT